MYSNEGKARIPMATQMPLMMNAGNSGAGTHKPGTGIKRAFQDN